MLYKSFELGIANKAIIKKNLSVLIFSVSKAQKDFRYDVLEEIKKRRILWNFIAPSYPFYNEKKFVNNPIRFSYFFIFICGFKERSRWTDKCKWFFDMQQGNLHP